MVQPMRAQITPLPKVQRYGQEIPVAWLRCRDGHDWRDVDAYIVGDRKSPLYNAEYSLERCHRCEGTKERWISTLGMLLKSTYTMPDGYSLTGEGRIDKQGRAALRRIARSRRSLPVRRSPQPTRRTAAAKKRPAGKSSASDDLASVHTLFKAPA